MILVDNVIKDFGPTRAVDGVSFTVEPGEIVGFLGPNGAGKSTVLKMLSTWLAPTSGRIEIAGHDVTRAPLAVRSALGYLPEHDALYESMRVDHFLTFIGRVHGLAGDVLRSRLDRVVERCDLGAVRTRRIRECSKGFRQRIGLAAAWIHDPPVVVLDEPTHGLDPLQVVAFRDVLFELRAGRSILLSSHVLAEVEAICDRVLILGGGRLLADRRVDDLQREAAENGTTVERVVLDTVRAGAAERERSRGEPSGSKTAP